MYTERLRRTGLGDLLTEPNLPLTPENLAAGYNRDPYNQAVAAVTALYEQREAIWQTPEYAYKGTALQMTVLAPEIAAATQVVQTYEARIREIDAARGSLTPEQEAAGILRATFDGWFEQIFKPIFSTSLGATTNEDTLRREIEATWAPGHPEWADEVIAWIRSSPVSWKLAPNGEPFPVPGATTVTYQTPTGPVTLTPKPGESVPQPSFYATPTPITPPPTEPITAPTAPAAAAPGPVTPTAQPAPVYAGPALPPSGGGPTYAIPGGGYPTPTMSADDTVPVAQAGIGKPLLIGAGILAVVLWFGTRRGGRPKGYRRY